MKTSFFARIAVVAGVALSAISCGGCMSATMHVMCYDMKFSDAGAKPLYPGTRSAAACIVDKKIWKEKSFVPAALCFIDLPFDIVLDTVLLPLDLYEHCRDSSDISFWENVFSENKFSLPVEMYERHLSRCGRSEVRRALKSAKDNFGEKNQAAQNEKAISPEMKALLEQHPEWRE